MPSNERIYFTLNIYHSNCRQGRTSEDAIVLVCKGQAGQYYNETNYKNKIPDFWQILVQ